MHTFDHSHFALAYWHGKAKTSNLLQTLGGVRTLTITNQDTLNRAARNPAKWKRWKIKQKVDSLLKNHEETTRP